MEVVGGSWVPVVHDFVLRMGKKLRGEATPPRPYHLGVAESWVVCPFEVIWHAVSVEGWVNLMSHIKSLMRIPFCALCLQVSLWFRRGRRGTEIPPSRHVCICYVCVGLVFNSFIYACNESSFYPSFSLIIFLPFLLNPHLPNKSLICFYVFLSLMRLLAWVWVRGYLLEHGHILVVRSLRKMIPFTRPLYPLLRPCSEESIPALSKTKHGCFPLN